MEEFLERCFYQAGQYASEEDYIELDRKLREKEVPFLNVDFSVSVFSALTYEQ